MIRLSDHTRALRPTQWAAGTGEGEPMVMQDEYAGPVPLSEFAASDQDFETGVMLPASCYTDESFFAFEREAVFGAEWLCLGRSDQVANPGDYYTITMAGEP